MALTDHQVKHLQAHADNIDSDRKRPAMILKLRALRGETDSRYRQYTNRVKNQALGRIASGLWPEGLKNDFDVHDYLDAERSDG